MTKMSFLSYLGFVFLFNDNYQKQSCDQRQDVATCPHQGRPVMNQDPCLFIRQYKDLARWANLILKSNTFEMM